MDLILDTCGLLSLSGLARRKLKPRTLKRIQQASTLYVSACSLFEIALKTKRGQLNLAPFTSAKDYWEEAIQAYHCVSLAVQAEDFDNAVQLPDHHIDPFDRIIIAQAIRTKSEIVTYDDRFSDYSVTVHD